jgi:hypothetical protein
MKFFQLGENPPITKTPATRMPAMTVDPQLRLLATRFSNADSLMH